MWPGGNPGTAAARLGGMTTVALRRLLPLLVVPTLAVAFLVPPASAELPAPTRTATSTGAGEGTGYPTLVGVRWAAHPAYDRVVFDFANATPGWRAAYEPLRAQGTGDVVPLAGAATLALTFHVARTAIALRAMYPALPTLRQVGWGGDFEGYVGAGLGLRDRVGFRVFALSGPPRVVVDVAHQPAAPFGYTAVSRAGTAANALVGGIRTGVHPGYDRVVFDVTGTALPTVRVAYASSTSTTVVVTLVALGSATAAPHASCAVPLPLTTGLTALRSVSGTAGAGVLTFRLATSRRHGFRVAVLTGPTRVVTDLAH